MKAKKWIKKIEVGKEIENLRRQIHKQEDYIEFATYQNLEKIYIGTMQKIGDALSLIKTLKLKKQDQDRLIDTLVSNK